MISLLLLDLDGVVVIEAALPRAANLEILLLHWPLRQIVCDVGIPVVALTHRSRVEARRILRLAGLSEGVLAGLLAAEDILHAALKSKRRWSLLSDGLRNSWALAEVESRYGVPRRDIAFIDDQRRNLHDMARSGVGLAILAPSGISTDGSKLVSFDFRELAQLLREWNGLDGPQIRVLTSQVNRIEEWCRTGVGASRRWHLFGQARRCGRAIRRLIGTV